MKIEYTYEDAREKGLKALEKEAKEKLRSMYDGDWTKAVIKADYQDGKVTYEIKERKQK